MWQKLIGALALLISALPFAQAQTLSREIRERIILSTVMVLPTDQNGKLDGTLGSGTLISPLGYILTNYHVVGDPDNRVISPWLQIRVIRFVDQEPEFRYWGKVVAADPNLDLAIVQIVQDKNEKAVSNLNLPYVELGDSNKMIIGDPIFVFGFQGTGGMTLSFSRGSVGGFTGEDRESSGKQWMKHDAQTGPGNSGGGVYNQDGALIGVHTAGIAGNNNSRTAFMRPLALAWGLITPNVRGFVVQGQGQATTTTTTTQPLNPPAGWPSITAVGQTWSVSMPDSIIWTVKLTDKDKDGDPAGTAVSNKGVKLSAFFYYLPKDDVIWLDMTADSNSYYFCRFDPQAFNGSTLQGTAYYRKSKDAQDEKIGNCSAKLGGAATTTANASNLSWPINPQVGQTWVFNIQSGGIWTVVLSGRSDKGNPMGPATSNKGDKWTGFFYYEKDKNDAWLDLTADGKSYTSCFFDSKSVSGKTLQGTAYYYKDENANGEKIGTCTASLK